MSKQRMMVFDDYMLVDPEIIWKAIEEANGDWKKVEKEMDAYLEAVQAMVKE